MTNYHELPKVAVILGAGASLDCWDGRSGTCQADWKPPLVKELFVRPAFWKFTQPYPGARVLNVDLAAESSAGELKLEDRLRWYAQHDQTSVREQFKEIPLYLRDVLHEVSQSYVEYPATFVHMLQELLNYQPHRVAIITTNYDTLAEKALRLVKSDHTMSNIWSYIKQDRQALVFKLHGSVDWVTPMSSTGGEPTTAAWEEAFASYDPLRSQTERDIILSGGSREFARHWFAAPDGQPRRPVFPVLTAPLAGKGDHDLVCPPSHLSELKAFLADCHKFLVAGTSGLDQDVLKLLRENAVASPATVHFVGMDRDDATTVGQRFVAEIPQWQTIDWQPADASGFREFIFGPRFKAFASELEGSKS